MKTGSGETFIKSATLKKGDMMALLMSECERPREWPNWWTRVCTRLVPLYEFTVQYSVSSM